MAASATRTTLFGIFVLAGRPLTARQVVALARPLGISATNVKSHLTRMVADGALQRAGRPRLARYWPSASQTVVVEGINARLKELSNEPWDRRWLVLTLQLPAKRAERERRVAWLWFDGFRQVGPQTFVRPAWPHRWALERARRHLAQTPGICVNGTLMETINPSGLNKMYRLDQLDREASRLSRHLRKLPAAASPELAFAAQLIVGGHVARLVGHDPRLPRALWAGRTGMRNLVAAYRQYERRLAPDAQRFVREVLKS